MGSHEHITKNDQRSSGCWDVKAGRAEEALALVIDDVVLLRECVRLATQDNIEIRTRAVAVNGVFLVERRDWENRFCANELCDVFDGRSWQSQERSARIHNGLVGGHDRFTIDL